VSNRKNPITRHSIGVVSRRTGLKPDVIRAWERRYDAIQPHRTATNRRLYSDEEIERLLLLRQGTLAGRQIGQIGHLSTEELRDLVAADREALARAPRPVGRSSVREYDGESHFAACLAAIENLDSRELHHQLDRSVVELPPQRVIDVVLVPLLDRIGALWEEGALRVAHEHMASSIIGAFLTTIQGGYVSGDTAPPILVGTPVRQFHELGALMVAATAASEGWRVLYLGANLPAEEFAAAGRQKGAAVLALSLVYPGGDPHLERELLRLRRLVGEGVKIVAGGRAVESYRAILDRIDALIVEDMSEFRTVLRQSRTP
jgi:MerR family transcriptional regulator, light-induced transcriptional regulator